MSIPGEGGNILKKRVPILAELLQSCKKYYTQLGNIAKWSKWSWSEHQSKNDVSQTHNKNHNMPCWGHIDPRKVVMDAFFKNTATRGLNLLSVFHGSCFMYLCGSSHIQLPSFTFNHIMSSSCLVENISTHFCNGNTPPPPRPPLMG